jgi:hypothetical protein
MAMENPLAYVATVLITSVNFLNVIVLVVIRRKEVLRNLRYLDRGYANICVNLR